MKQRRAVLAALMSLALFAGCKQHKNTVSTVDYSSDGLLIASGSFDRTVRIWDAAKRAHLRTLEGHTGEGHTDYLSAVSFSPDNKTLLSACSNQEDILLWSVETGELLRTLQDDKASGFSNAAFSLDGRLVAGASDGLVILWDVQTGEQLRAHEGAAFDFLPDGKTLATGGEDGVYLWDIATGDSTGKIEMNKKFWKMSFSPDGKTLAVLVHIEPIELWDVETGKLIKRLQSGDLYHAVAFSPDGKMFASASSKSRIHLWNADTGGLIKKFGNRGGVSDLAFSPDGTTLIAGAYKAIHFYSLKND